MLYNTIGWKEKWRIWRLHFNLEYRSGNNLGEDLAVVGIGN